MARAGADPLNNTQRDLDQLLSRLDRSLLSNDADPNLRHSPYARRKLAANVEYARTLLLRLEHDASTIKIQSRRQSLSASLQSKRDLVKSLNRRLLELEQLGDDDEDDSSSSSGASGEEEGEGEDGEGASMREYAPAQATPSAGLDTAQAPNALRSRRQADGDNDESDTQTDTARSTGNALFSGRNTTVQGATGSSSTAQAESLLAHNDREQEAIKSSLVSLAQRLKQSSLAMSSALEADKEALDKAEGGLDRNALGMEAAGRRMGTLRRMTEGQGWYGRIKLYAIIAALWIAAFVIVFIGPKFRF